ncbi:MAG TPA: peptidylprolyl isomerase [Verrucomicrobiae bacterium]|nr:peptidylprolyl isomerase [Verrucomicrobiae bacterium]
MKTRVVFTVFVLTGILAGRALAANSAAAPAVSTNKPAIAEAISGTDVVARVNGVEITGKDLNAALRAYNLEMARLGRRFPAAQAAALPRIVLDELIGRQLILQQGYKQPPADLDKMVQGQIAQMKADAGGEAELGKKLKASDTTMEEVTRQIRDGVVLRETIRSTIDKRVTITTNDARAFYEANPEQFKQPEMVRASHILIACAPDAADDVKKDKRAQIEAALALVRGGEKFADVARKVSEDPGTAENGGDLGYFPRGRMVPEFDTVAFSLKTNEISGIITTQFGYHILTVTGRKPAQPMAFEDVKDRLMDYLKQRKAGDAMRTYVADLRQAAKVEVLLPLPPAAAVPVPGVDSPGAARSPAK